MTDDASLVERAVADIAAWYDVLVGYLPARPTETSETHGSPDHGLKVDHSVIRTRDNIRRHMHEWARIGITEGPFHTQPQPTVHSIAAWLRTRNHWYCTQDWSPEYVRETLYLRDECAWHQQPNKARRIRLRDARGDGYPCPEPDCKGTLIAVMRPADDLLPPEVRCDVEAADGEHHAWAAGEWLTLGRRVLRADAG